MTQKTEPDAYLIMQTQAAVSPKLSKAMEDKVWLAGQEEEMQSKIAEYTSKYNTSFEAVPIQVTFLG